MLLGLSGEECFLILFFVALLYSGAYFGLKRGRLGSAAPASHPESSALPPQQDASTIMGDSVWLHMLNAQPDRYPHILIAGPTGAGKTTLACALLSQRAGKTALVITPKLNAGNWRGAALASLDAEGGYTEIESALAWAETEKRRRCVALRAGEAIEELTLIIDETPEVCAHVRVCGELIKSLASLGREIKLRLIIITTSTRVAALGITGRGDTVNNFARLEVGLDRRVTWGDQELDGRRVLALAQCCVLEPADMGGGMAQNISADIPDMGAAPPPQQDMDTDTIPDDRRALLEMLIRAGWGTNRICKQVKGDRNAVSAEISALRKNLQQEPPSMLDNSAN